MKFRTTHIRAVVPHLMNKTEKEILTKKFDLFDLEENLKHKIVLQKDLIKAFKEHDRLDTDDYQLWGLVYYSPSDERTSNTELAIKKFKQAYTIDSNNYMACLYIAHCYQDKNEYKTALKYYELVNQKELKEFQLWRYVKLIEQIGFCYYKTGQQDIGREYFIETLDLYKNYKTSELAVPSELLECLSENDGIVREIKKIEDYLK